MNLRAFKAFFYSYLSKEELENNVLAHLILEYDERFNHILGYRRMTRWINKINSKIQTCKRIITTAEKGEKEKRSLIQKSY